MLRAAADDARWGGYAWNCHVSAAHSAAVALARAATPLTGLTFTTKDHIDAARLSTTTACPAFFSKPTEDASAIHRVLPANATLLAPAAPTNYTVTHMRADPVRLNPLFSHYNHFTSALASPPASGKCR